MRPSVVRRESLGARRSTTVLCGESRPKTPSITATRSCRATAPATNADRVTARRYGWTQDVRNEEARQPIRETESKSECSDLSPRSRAQVYERNDLAAVAAPVEMSAAPMKVRA